MALPQRLSRTGVRSETFVFQHGGFHPRAMPKRREFPSARILLGRGGPGEKLLNLITRAFASVR